VERPRLGELLIQAGVIDETALARALDDHERTGRRLGHSLLALDFIDEETLVRTVARQLSIPVVWLRGKRVGAEVLDLLPRDFIEKHRCLPVLLDQRVDRTLLVAMEDPSDRSLIDEIAQHTRLAVKPVIAAPSELEEAIQRHFGLTSMPLSLDPLESDLRQPDLLRMAPERPPRRAPLPLPPLASLDPSEGDVPNAPFNERVLRTLTQLLIEKGILTRAELVERLADDDAPAEPEAT
jgi:type IV pilus assembly protein PilB